MKPVEPEAQGQRELYRKHAEVLHVLSNPLRHEIVHHLAAGAQTTGDLVTLTGATKSNVSQHLALLKAYGLIEQVRTGRSVSHRLAYPQLTEACRLIDEVLLDQAKKSASMLESLTPGSHSTD